MTHPVSRRSEVALARLERGELAPLARKVLSGERLDAEDGLELYRTGDLLGLGCLANLVREARHGDVASFVRNVHVNPTNVCAFTCEFCAFGVKKGQPDAYETNLEEVARTLEPLGRLGLREVHMVGGVHPDWPYETWLDYVRTIRRTLPDVGIKAYTAVEIDWMARISGRSHAGVLADLLEAGLTALPGGASLPTLRIDSVSGAMERARFEGALPVPALAVCADGTAGAFAVRVSVDAGGHISARAGRGMSSTVRRCVVTALEAMTLPAGSGPTRARVTITFAARAP